MTDILAEIIDYKREFVKQCKARLPFYELESIMKVAPPVRDFPGAVRNAGGCALIAEVKTASPSKGLIRDVDPISVAMIYEANGASCISVLTDEKYFRGNLERLSQVRRSVLIPLLRKDFIIDPYQLYEARVAGADAVLLIASCLDECLLRELRETAARLGLSCLVEVHDEREMKRVSLLNADMIGINNRNLSTFVTSLEVTERLARIAPENALVVSESGIFSRSDMDRVHKMGADAVLIGEALMRAPDIGKKVREFTGR
jgi:indole-3-glycerol phosphate synthase